MWSIEWNIKLHQSPLGSFTEIMVKTPGKVMRIIISLILFLPFSNSTFLFPSTQSPSPPKLYYLQQRPGGHIPNCLKWFVLIQVKLMNRSDHYRYRRKEAQRPTKMHKHTQNWRCTLRPKQSRSCLGKQLILLLFVILGSNQYFAL